MYLVCIVCVRTRTHAHTCTHARASVCFPYHGGKSILVPDMKNNQQYKQHFVTVWVPGKNTWWKTFIFSAKAATERPVDHQRFVLAWKAVIRQISKAKLELLVLLASLCKYSPLCSEDPRVSYVPEIYTHTPTLDSR